jgi:hypothetical protein
MTKSDWDKALRGDADREVIVKGEHVWARYLVADAISTRARELKNDRPDKAGVLTYIASKVRAGYAPSKRVLLKGAKELDVIRATAVDGKRLDDA